jgi:hypothetical protein
MVFLFLPLLSGATTQAQRRVVLLLHYHSSSNLSPERMHTTQLL